MHDRAVVDKQVDRWTCKGSSSAAVAKPLFPGDQRGGC